MGKIAIEKCCHHIKQDGSRCGAPALRGKTLCYYHNRIHNGTAIAPYHACRTIRALNTKHNIRVAAAAVARDLRAGVIDLESARVMIWCIQVANQTLKDMEDLTRLGRLDLVGEIAEADGFPR